MKHANNFGFLRLFLAVMVIAGHAPEMVEGNSSGEFLTRIFHTLSLGDVAVDGFFLISGYLVAGSYLASPSTLNFLTKRILRIYPGYCVVWFFCMLVVTPLSGAPLWPFTLVQSVVYIYAMFFLIGCSSPGTFQGLHYHALNGPLWTIGYEFRCYLTLALVGFLGLLNRRYLFAAIAVLLVIGYTTCIFTGTILAVHGFVASAIFVYPNDFLRLMSLFFWGACYYLFRKEITFTPLSAIICACWLIECLRFPDFARFGVTIFGSYILFLSPSRSKNPGCSRSIAVPIFPTVPISTPGPWHPSSFSTTGISAQ